jgi:uncharacterized protein (TIGR02271 family)
MANTVIGLFEDADDAQEAVQKLVEKGFGRDDIDITAAGNYAGTGSDAGRGESHEGFGDKIDNFFSSLFGGDDDEAGRHSEVLRHGGTLVTVHAVSGDRAETAADILDECGAIDVDERSAQYRGTGQQDYDRTDRTREATAAIPVVEEQLEVGKREVERGGVRVRSRVVERPVQEELRLREEHVNVERRPVDRPATEADLNRVTEGTFEVTERAEQAVVNKQARVVEEVAIGKEVQERTETVSDTLRKTEVDVERVEGDTKTRGKGTGR